MSNSGTTTASITFGGIPVPARHRETELWNGTNWTEVNDLNTGRQRLGGIGVSTAALAYGGDKEPAPYSADTEIWNGTNWTETSNLSAARSFLQGAGTYTVGVAFAGETGTAISAATEEFTGASTPTVEFDLS